MLLKIMGKKPRLKRFGWKEEYETGLRAIDLQHRFLFERFDELASAIEEEGKWGALLGALLVSLRYYAEWHFGREEQIFSCALPRDDPAVRRNEEEHAHFSQRFAELHRTYLQAKSNPSSDLRSLAAEIHAELADWLENHVLKLDRSLARRCLAATRKPAAF